MNFIGFLAIALMDRCHKVARLVVVVVAGFVCGSIFNVPEHSDGDPNLICHDDPNVALLVTQRLS